MEDSLTKSIENMIQHLHLTNAKAIKRILDKNGISCTLSDLRFIFPPAKYLSNGELKSKLKQTKDNSILSKKLQRILQKIIHDEREERISTNKYCSDWKVPSGRHWPVFGELLVALQTDNIWNKTERKCVLCQEKLVGSGHDAWKQHTDTEIHLKNKLRHEGVREEEKESCKSLERLFSYYSSLGAPFELHRMGILQFKCFCLNTSVLICPGIQYKMTAQELCLIMEEIFECYTNNYDGNLGRWVSFDEWRDILEITFRFLFVGKFSESSISNLKEVTIDLTRRSTCEFKRLIMVSILNNYRKRNIDATLEYMTLNSIKNILIKHQYCLRNIFYHFGYSPGHKHDLYLLQEEDINFSLGVNAIDSEAVQMSLEGFLQFSHTFGISNFCNDDDIKRTFQKCISYKHTTLRSWQFIEAVGYLSVLAFPPKDLQVRCFFLSDSIVNFTLDLIQKDNPPIKEYEAEKIFPAINSRVRTNRDIKKEESTKYSIDPVVHLPIVVETLKRPTWYPFNQKLKPAKSVKGKNLIFSLPQALNEAKHEGEVWLKRSEFPETTTCLAPEVNHMGDAFLPQTRFKLLNRPHDNSLAKKYISSCERKRLLEEKMQRTTVIQRRNYERRKMKIRAAAREHLQNNSGQALNFRSNQLPPVNIGVEDVDPLGDEFDSITEPVAGFLSTITSIGTSSVSTSSSNSSKISDDKSSIIQLPPVILNKSNTDNRQDEKFLSNAVSLDLNTFDFEKSFFESTVLDKRKVPFLGDLFLSPTPQKRSWASELGSESKI